MQGIALIPILFLIIAAVAQHKSGDDEATLSKKASSGLFARVDTWIGRVENFIYGGKEADNDEMYQVNQAKIAIAKGGLVGVGPGNSTTRDYLPQAYNDFIFAIIIEEYGFIGGAFIVFIYLVFLYRCIRIFKRCPVCIRCIPGIGIKFYTGHTGYSEYGGNSEFISGNRCDIAIGKYGRNEFHIYLFGDRNHIECGKKRGTVRRESKVQATVNQQLNNRIFK